jgi:tetratricopeptide (TPR) repeat protein
MTEESIDVFISYRRSDAGGHARALYRDLARRFDEDRLFFDRSSIESGDVFPDKLRGAVVGCKVLLALIGPTWLDAKGPTGMRRLDDLGDFVRQEITLALEHGKRVIPVLFDDTPVPSAGQLPGALRGLATFDALTVRGKTYEYNVQLEELMRLVARVPGVPAPRPADDVPGQRQPLGLTREQVRDAMREVLREQSGAQVQVGKLSSTLQTTREAVIGFFRILEREDVPLERLPETLAEIAERHRVALRRLRVLDIDDPEVQSQVTEARDAVAVGAYDRADALFAAAETAELQGLREAEALARGAIEAADRRRRGVAAARSKRGEIALIEMDYLEAAGHFEMAAGLVPASDYDLRGNYLHAQANALYERGARMGDNGSLRSAVTIYRAALEEYARERVPLDWAMTQNNLGNALRTLGEREAGMARLEEAVAAYRAALEEYTRERVPLHWALTQNNLGNALRTLGEGEAGTARLEEAVAAYRAALEEGTRERVPLAWAMTQNNLGVALWTLGGRETGTAWLEEAVAAYRAALEERTRERVPLDWAATQNNLGVALWTLGEREAGTARLEEAVAAYRAALEEYTRERVPLDWAMTQNNLGTVLWALGQRGSDLGMLHAARAAMAAAREMYRAAGHDAYDAYFEQQVAAIDGAIGSLAPPSRRARWRRR